MSYVIEKIQSVNDQIIDTLVWPFRNYRLWILLAAAPVALWVGYFIASGNMVFALLPVLIAPAVIVMQRPFLGVLFLVVLIPLEEFTRVGGDNVTLMRLVGLLIAGIWLLSVLTRNERYIPPPGWKWLALILVWDALSVLWAYYPSSVTTRLVVEIQLVVLFLMAIDLVRTRRQAYIILTVFAIATLVAALVAFSQFASGETVKRLSLTSSEGSGGNQFAHLMSLGAIISIAGFAHYKRSFRWLFMVAGGVFVLALFASASRTGLIVVTISAILVAFLEVRDISFGLKALGVAALILLVGWYATTYFQLIPEKTLARLSAGEAIDDLLYTRGDFTRVGIEMVKDNPLVGVGLDNYPGLFTHYQSLTSGLHHYWNYARDAHNDYLRRASELGIIGFVLFIGFLVTIVQLAIATAKLPKFDRFLWYSAVGMLSVTLMSSFANSFQWRKRYWFVLAFVVIVYNISSRESVAVARVEEPDQTDTTEPSRSRVVLSRR